MIFLCKYKVQSNILHPNMFLSKHDYLREEKIIGFS